jgi:hypothetical protein
MNEHAGRQEPQVSDITASRTAGLERGTFALLLSVAAVNACLYFYDIHLPNLDVRLELHTQIISGTALSPYRYRVLLPFLVEGFARLLTSVAPYSEAVMVGYIVFDLLELAIFYPVMHRFLRTWYAPEQSLIGTLFTATPLVVALRAHQFQPWSLLEPTLLTLGLLLMIGRQYAWLGMVTLAATLNRETGIFIPIAFCLTAIPWRSLFSRQTIPWPDVFKAAAYFAVWGVTYAGIRFLRGPAPPIHTLADLWALNTDGWSLYLTAQNWVLFLGAFWVFIVPGYRRAPTFLCRAAWIIPMYVVMLALFGRWYETRLLIPVYPLLIGLGLAYLFEPQASQPA